MLTVCADEVEEIQRLWPRFEQLVGLRGRKMYAMVDLGLRTYTACTPVLDRDEPGTLGLEVGELAGGSFRRGRLRGDPPGVYEAIAPGFDELTAAGEVDPDRALVEFYKRQDEIELWVPLPSP
jgi:hypothetical protein